MCLPGWGLYQTLTLHQINLANCIYIYIYIHTKLDKHLEELMRSGLQTFCWFRGLLRPLYQKVTLHQIRCHYSTIPGPVGCGSSVGGLSHLFSCQLKGQNAPRRREPYTLATLQTIPTHCRSLLHAEQPQIETFVFALRQIEKSE